MTRRERKALLYFARHVNGDKSWHWRLWWEAIDLLPFPEYMPRSLQRWAPIAESMALSTPIG